MHIIIPGWLFYMQYQKADNFFHRMCLEYVYPCQGLSAYVCICSGMDILTVTNPNIWTI